MARRPIARERAERIARSRHCPQCLEYSFKKLVARPAPKSQRDELGAVWIISRVCGVCGMEQDLALDADGELVYEA